MLSMILAFQGLTKNKIKIYLKSKMKTENTPATDSKNLFLNIINLGVC